MNLDAVFPPMATVFDRAGEIDSAAISANVAHWIAGRRRRRGGARFERRGAVCRRGRRRAGDRGGASLGAARPRAHRRHGRESTRATIAASARAAAAGADAVLVRTPSFFKARMTADVFVRHYTAVADATPVPVLLYNVPGGDRRQSDARRRRPAREPSEHHRREGNRERHRAARGVRGRRAERVRGHRRIGARRSTRRSASARRAASSPSRACCPALCVELHEHFRAGRHAEARDLQRRLTPLAKLVTTGFGVAGTQEGDGSCRLHRRRAPGAARAARCRGGNAGARRPRHAKTCRINMIHEVHSPGARHLPRQGARSAHGAS